MAKRKKVKIEKKPIGDILRACICLSIMFCLIVANVTEIIRTLTLVFGFFIVVFVVLYIISKPIETIKE